MPGLPVIADVIRTTIHRDDGLGRSANNVMHFLSAGYDVTGLDASLQANVDRSMWDAVWEGYGHITLNYLPLDGFSATTTILPTTPTDWQGEGSGELIPQSAVLVKLRTGFRGRSKRGRLYLGGIGEDRQNAGTVPTATLTEMQTKWEAFAAAMQSDGFPLQVASYTLASSEAAVAVIVENMCGTQRRRMSQLR